MYIARIPCQGRVGGMIRTFEAGEMTDALDEGKEHPHFDFVEDVPTPPDEAGRMTDVLDGGKEHPHFDLPPDEAGGMTDVPDESKEHPHFDLPTDEPRPSGKPRAKKKVEDLEV